MSWLCARHCLEGARVCVQEWVFRDADDVVRGSDVPPVAAVLSGHVHRHQVLTRDLRGEPLAAPVLFSGSVERTSVAERGEPKGFLLLGFAGGRLVRWQFEELPTRPIDSAHGQALAAHRRLAHDLERAGRVHPLRVIQTARVDQPE